MSDCKLMWRCPRCQWPGFDIPIRKEELPIHHDCKQQGVGDAVAATLASIGVHKQEGCYCGERQRLLNRTLSKLHLKPLRWRWIRIFSQWLQCRRFRAVEK